MTGRVLIAIGGNALSHPDDLTCLAAQQQRAAGFADQIAQLAAQGWEIVITHGNGPQVGYILRRGEMVAAQALSEGLPDLPLWLAVADSQGGIGHLLAIALMTALQRAGLDRTAVALLTHCEVDASDPAFHEYTKPIGAYLSQRDAEYHQRHDGWQVVPVGAGQFRRVVPSPRPRRILETEHIAALSASGAIVIAAGGGGIPVVADGAHRVGVDAVIDKDRASAMLAADIDVDTLMLVTGVDHIYVDFGTPAQRAVGQLTVSEATAHLAAGQFPPGSMGPKVESAIDFVNTSSRRAIITSMNSISAALAGRCGTNIVPTPI